MIDYIPPDIPLAIVEYVHNHNKNLPEEVTGLAIVDGEEYLLEQSDSGKVFKKKLV